MGWLGDAQGSIWGLGGRLRSIIASISLMYASLSEEDISYRRISTVDGMRLTSPAAAPELTN